MPATPGRLSLPADNDEALEGRSMLGRTVMSILLALALGVLAGWLFRDQLTWLGTWLVNEYGSGGVFVSVFVIDWVPMPATNEPILLLGVSAGMNLLKLFVAAASASVIAALASYGGGHLVDSHTSLGDRMARAYPGVTRLVRERGATGIAIAAMVPLPFSIFCWTAGIVHVPFRQVAVASLLRIPKTAFYLWLIVAGWGLT